MRWNQLCLSCLWKGLGVGEVLYGPDVGLTQDLMRLKVGALPVVRRGRVRGHADDDPAYVRRITP